MGVKPSGLGPGVPGGVNGFGAPGPGTVGELTVGANPSRGELVRNGARNGDSSPASSGSVGVRELGDGELELELVELGAGIEGSGTELRSGAPIVGAGSSGLFVMRGCTSSGRRTRGSSTGGGGITGIGGGGGGGGALLVGGRRSGPIGDGHRIPVTIPPMPPPIAENTRPATVRSVARRAAFSAAMRSAARRARRAEYSAASRRAISRAREVIRSGVTRRGSAGSCTRPGSCIAPGGL